MQYRHPGAAFLSRYGSLQSEADVSRYVEFLRQESGLSDQPPIDLSRIYDHFGMPTPLRAPLDQQQGILVDSATGIILIKEDDPIVRQRFTEGHELMELLFDAQDQARVRSVLPRWSEPRKEQLCDQGAADLLMPESSFVTYVNQQGISFATGRNLAQLYQTSLLATLIRMIQLGSGSYAIVMWHRALKQEEVNRDRPLPKKLRIWWRTRTKDWLGGFIPKNKSIGSKSLIFLAYSTGRSQTGSERIDLGWGAVDCQVEAMAMQIGDKPCVLSLLQVTP
ncbi:ImmA/IrrE family metallo-endopeptidase [Pantanalinema rosaneae CENA516]|uniref:ImmA/IrrE family metallo-endopeptidase n=1 Tax=Pantanalinema rosaneae TaxID=1620701 RepID=UPI003D6E8E33